MEAKLRKYETSLLISGRTVAAFSVWSIIKAVTSMLFGLGDLNKFIDTKAGNYAQQNGYLFSDVQIYLYTWIIAVLVIDFCIRLFTGFTASKKAQGKTIKKGRQVLWIILSVILLAIECYSLGYEISAFFTTSYNDVIDNALSCVIEVTSVAVIIQMLVSDYRVKKLRNIASKEGED